MAQERMDIGYKCIETNSTEYTSLTPEVGALYWLEDTKAGEEDVNWETGSIMYWDGAYWQSFVGPHPKHRPQ